MIEYSKAELENNILKVMPYVLGALQICSDQYNEFLVNKKFT